MTAPYCLENESYHVEVDAEAGRFISVVDRSRGFELIAEPALAGNFRLLLPLPGIGCNYINGCEQALSSCDVAGNCMTLTWRGPLNSQYGAFDLDVVMRTALVDQAIEFTCDVRNGTEHKLAEVWYPVFGGMMGLGPEGVRRETIALVPLSNEHWQQNIFADFGDTRGQTLGVPGGEHSFCYPGFMPMPWVSLYNPALDCGLYVAALEDTPRVKTLRFALDAGMGRLRPHGNWPRPGEHDGPIGLEMNWAHNPFTPPGETFQGAKIVVQGHEGDWRGAAALYRQWFDEHYDVVDPKKHWIRGESAFLHTMCMLPEDNICLPFKDLPQWGEAAKQRGINSVCIAGWNIGGHDRGYPQYEPDPKLGTWEELEAGVRACKAMGLRVYFFVNCQPVDMSIEWYKKELHKYRILDLYGEQFFIINYWGMGTLGARSRFFTARPFGEISPAHPEVRELLTRQMRKLAEIGADGVHIDKFFQTPMDFNPRLTHTSPDRAHHEGMLLYVEEMTGACRAVNPEFCFSYEGAWDRLMPYTDVSWWGNTDDPMKAVFPERVLTTGVEQPYDYNKANLAILRGDVLLIGPGNYLYGADYPPMQDLLAYLGEIARIRTDLWDMVSLGTIEDASGGLFKRREPMLHVAGPFADSEHGRWVLYRDRSTDKRCAILVNLAPNALDAADLALADNATGACCIRQAFESDVKTHFPASITVPGERAVFVVES